MSNPILYRTLNKATSFWLIKINPIVIVTIKPSVMGVKVRDDLHQRLLENKQAQILKQIQVTLRNKTLCV